jgi:hypothetical protein
MNVLVKAALAAAALVAVGCAAGASAAGASAAGASAAGASAAGASAAGASAAGASAAGASAASASAAAPRGSVPACTAFGVRAIDQRQTVTQMPAACRGLSRAEINLALGRAIYLVAGSGQRKVAWRHRAAVEGARLARLITALAQSSPGPGPASPAAGGPGGRTGPVDHRPLGLAALAAWLLTVASGGYMLGRFVAGGGLRRQLATGDRTGPAVVLSHFFLASTGLLLWAVYLATSVLGVAWAAVALLLPVIGFGMGTLVLWTSGRSRRPARTSSAPAGTSAGTSPGTSGRPGTPSGTSSADAPGQVQVAQVRDQAPPGQTAPAQRPSRWLTVIIPIGHGLLAMTTILLALLTALGAS